jgi:ferric-dicitrate binding protein FerR (iron transport regulator)
MSQIDKNRIDNYFKEEFSSVEDKYLSNASAEEKQAEELQAIFKEQWEKILPDDSKSDHLDHILYKLNFLINSDKSDKSPAPFVKLYKWYAKVAAILILPLLLYAGFLTFKPKPHTIAEGWAEISAPRGARIKFMLPDGSLGWLNRGSTIKYPLNFSQNREVQLIGEAYFDVKHDDINKFTVKTKYLDVQVRGTSFDVAAYKDEQEVDVTLVQGSVLLSGGALTESVEMKPNEKVTYNISRKTLEKEIVTTQNYTSWKEGKLMLRNANIEELAKQLSHWYNVEVLIEKSQKTEIRYRATFEDENLDEVLRLLKISSHLDYRFVERVKQDDGSFTKRKVILNINKPN